jgi:hypothetical protein
MRAFDAIAFSFTATNASHPACVPDGLERLPFFPVIDEKTSARTQVQMKALLRQMKLELAGARDTTLLLAIVAGFIAWSITAVLRGIFG